MSLRFALISCIVSAGLIACGADTGNAASPPETPAAAPVDLLPTDGVPGVMPPKPPRPSLGEDKGYDIADFDMDLAKRFGLKIGQDMHEVRLKLYQYNRGLGQSWEKKGNWEEIFLPSGLTQVVVTRTGLADDSVKAEQFLAIFKPLTPKTGQLQAYGMRIKCYRGANTTDWQAKPCP